MSVMQTEGYMRWSDTQKARSETLVCCPVSDFRHSEMLYKECHDHLTEQFVVINVIMPKSFSQGSRRQHAGPSKTQSKTVPGLSLSLQERIKDLIWEKEPDWSSSDIVPH